ncbi:DNA/RNA non-specific endonuclease [Ensifer sp. IC4062]|nr:DNA/RNA non-specific endonuclease [Ensifer sp. IC4062]
MQGLENFLLYNTDDEDVWAAVFSGPLFRTDEVAHRGILIPQLFWKVIAVSEKNGKLYTAAYVVGQQHHALDIPLQTPARILLSRRGKNRRMRQETRSKSARSSDLFSICSDAACWNSGLGVGVILLHRVGVLDRRCGQPYPSLQRLREHERIRNPDHRLS